MSIDDRFFQLLALESPAAARLHARNAIFPSDGEEMAGWNRAVAGLYSALIEEQRWLDILAASASIQPVSYRSTWRRRQRTPGYLDAEHAVQRAVAHAVRALVQEYGRGIEEILCHDVRVTAWRGDILEREHSVVLPVPVASEQAPDVTLELCRTGASGWSARLAGADWSDSPCLFQSHLASKKLEVSVWWRRAQTARSILEEECWLGTLLVNHASTVECRRQDCHMPAMLDIVCDDAGVHFAGKWISLRPQSSRAGAERIARLPARVDAATPDGRQARAGRVLVSGLAELPDWLVPGQTLRKGTPGVAWADQVKIARRHPESASWYQLYQPEQAEVYHESQYAMYIHIAADERFFGVTHPDALNIVTVRGYPWICVEFLIDRHQT